MKSCKLKCMSKSEVRTCLAMNFILLNMQYNTWLCIYIQVCTVLCCDVASCQSNLVEICVTWEDLLLSLQYYPLMHTSTWCAFKTMNLISCACSSSKSEKSREIPPQYQVSIHTAMLLSMLAMSVHSFESRQHADCGWCVGSHNLWKLSLQKTYWYLLETIFTSEVGLLSQLDFI